MTEGEALTPHRSFLTWMKRHQKLIRAAASALDPVVASLSVLLVQAALLATADKQEFARFSLAYSYVVMGQAIMSSLFGGPLVTLLARRKDKVEQDATGRAILRFQFFVSCSAAGFGIVVASAMGISTYLAAAAAAGLVGLSFRDALRSVLTSQMRVSESLILSLAFAIITILVLGIEYSAQGHIGSLAGLLALALGANLTLSLRLLQVFRPPESLTQQDRREMGRMAVWSLPGTIVVWFQNSFYLTLVAINIEMAAVGELSAARMTVMPILICSSGLLRLYQVQASAKVEKEGLACAALGARKLAQLLLSTTMAVAAMVWLTADHVPSRFVSLAHPHLIALSSAWVLFAGLSVARGVYSTLLQAMGRYRELFIVNLVLMPMVLFGVVEAPKYLGLVGAILPMAAGELAMLGIFAALIHRQC